MITLEEAISQGDLEMVEDILQRFPEKLNERSENGDTPLLLSAAKQKLEVCLYLLRKGADPRAQGQDGMTPLHFLSQNSGALQVETLAKLLISQKAEVDAESISGDTALYHACISGNLKLIEILVENGANINHLNKKATSAFHAALRSDNEEIINYLNAHGGVRMKAETDGAKMGSPLSSKSLRILAELEENVQRFEKFIDCLMEEDFEIAKLLLYAIPLSENEKVGKRLLNVLASKDKELKLMQLLLEFEVSKTPQESTLLRSLTPCTNFMSLCAKSISLNYLNQAIKPIIKDILQMDSLEVDPTKLQPNETANLQALISVCTNVFDKIEESVLNQEVPLKLCNLCYTVHSVIQKYFPASALSSVGGLFFLRLVVPCLITPESVGLIESKDISPVGRRNLILVSKVLQVLSNQLKFGKKEEYMIPLNQFIESRAERITVLLKKLGTEFIDETPDTPIECTYEDAYCTYGYVLGVLAKISESLHKTKPALFPQFLEMLKEVGIPNPPKNFVAPPGFVLPCNAISYVKNEPNKIKITADNLSLDLIINSPVASSAFKKYCDEKKLDTIWWGYQQAHKYLNLGDYDSRIAFCVNLRQEHAQEWESVTDKLSDENKKIVENGSSQGEATAYNSILSFLSLELKKELPLFAQSKHFASLLDKRTVAVQPPKYNTISEDSFTMFMQNVNFRDIYELYLHEIHGRGQLVMFLSAVDDYRQAPLKEERESSLEIILTEFISVYGQYTINFDAALLARIYPGLNTCDPLLLDELYDKTMLASSIYVAQFATSEYVKKFADMQKDTANHMRRFTSSTVRSGLAVGKAVVGKVNQSRPGLFLPKDFFSSSSPSPDNPDISLKSSDWKLLSNGSLTDVFAKDFVVIPKETVEHFLVVNSGSIHLGNGEIIKAGEFTGEISFVKGKKTSKCPENIVADAAGTSVTIIPFKALEKNLAADHNLAQRFFLMICRKLARKMVESTQNAVNNNKQANLKPATKSTTTLAETPKTTEAEQIVSKLKLPPSQVPIKSLTCTLLSGHLRTMQPRGTFIFLPNFVVFYSKTFNRKVQFVVPANEIESSSASGKKIKLVQKGSNSYSLKFKDEDTVKQVVLLLSNYAELAKTVEDTLKIGVSKTLVSSQNTSKTSLNDSQVKRHRRARSISDIDSKISQQSKESTVGLLSNSKWESLISAAEMKTFVKGQKIISHGCVSPCLVQIVTGRCRVEIPPPASGTDTPKKIAMCTPPAILGEIGFVLQTAATADVIADDDKVAVAVFDVAALNSFLSKNSSLAPEFYKYLAKTLAKRVLGRNASKRREDRKDRRGAISPSIESSDS